MILFLSFRGVFDPPLAPDGHRAAGEWQPGGHGGDGGDGRRAGVDATVPGFTAYGKKGVPRRASTAASWRLGVLSLVPMR